MKKFTAIVLALSIVFTVALSGCSGKAGGSVASDSSVSGNAGGSESVSSSEPDEGPTPAPKPVEGVNYIGVRVEIPAEIFYSQEDTPLAEMEKWRRYFTGECDFHRYTGNHFFILEHHREMAGVLRRRLL